MDGEGSGGSDADVAALPRRGRDIYDKSRSEAPPAPPPLRAPSAPAELHALLVAELHSALEQEHARVREQRDGLAQRNLRLWFSARSSARELLLRRLVAWFVHKHTAPRTARKRASND